MSFSKVTLAMSFVLFPLLVIASDSTAEKAERRMDVFNVDESYHQQIREFLEKGVRPQDSQANEYFTDEELAALEQQREMLRGRIGGRETHSRWFEGVNLHPHENLENNPYWQSAKEASQQTNYQLGHHIQQLSGITSREAGFFSGSDSTEASDTGRASKYVFISFSMPRSVIQDVLEQAAHDNAHVFINGLKPGHRGIQETMFELRDIAQEIDNPPVTRFNPDAFLELGIDRVPTIAKVSGGKAMLVSGITNFEWLSERSAETGNRVHRFDDQGPTSEVIEPSLIEEIQRRLAAIDWEQKQQDAIRNFWGNQTFHHLPKASESDEWFIDPTVRVTDDIVNPRGDQLAYAGQTLNPLNHATTNLTIYVFDGKDIEQINWLAEQLDGPRKRGQVMLISSRFNQKDGWEHLEILRGMFNSEVYLLPEEMVKRFQLSGLPARVETDLNKGLLHVKQFKLGDDA